MIPQSQITNRMAQVMADRVHASGACTDTDLQQAGFTLSEISQHSDAARKKARRETANAEG